MRHSAWSWKLVNERLVRMSPAALFTVSTPLATAHLAGDESLACTHSAALVPLNSTIASDGASRSVAPGVMILGTGVQTSVSSGFGRFVVSVCARTEWVEMATSANESEMRRLIEPPEKRQAEMRKGESR